jgi:hypothetical protein
MVEPLLCYDCEQKSSAFEDYAKRFFYGSSDPIRLSLPLLPDPVFTADYKKMKLFQLSILWRAAEATGEFFSAVILPTHHRERLRQMPFLNAKLIAIRYPSCPDLETSTQWHDDNF